MGSGSREYDFNQMADMGKAISDNKAALNDVRSNFVGPEQPREEAPVPTRVNLEATPEEMSRSSDVDKREKAYMAIRRLGEAGHDAANILLTPENIDKLSQWEDKASRVEQARMAYEQDPKQYAMDSANQLDGYIKSWNLKNLSPEQRTGASPGIVNAAEMLNEAASAPAQEEVPSVDGNVSKGPGMVQRSEGSGEAPAPRGQSPRSENGPAHSSKVSSGGGSTKADPASAAKIDVESLAHKIASAGMSLDSGESPVKTKAKVDEVTMSRPGAKVKDSLTIPSKKKFTPLPNQSIADSLGVPKAQRVKEYETPNTDGIVPLSTMGKAVDMMGGDFMRGVKGLTGMASNAVDTVLHPYGKEGEDNRRLSAARTKNKKQSSLKKKEGK